MGLLNGNATVVAEQKEVQVQVQDTAQDKKEARKEKKDAKRAALSKILDYCRTHNILTEEVDVLTPKRAGGFVGTDYFTMAFGENAKVGDTLSAFDMFTKTSLGVKQFLKKVGLTDDKKAKGKTRDVKYDENTKTFTVVAL